MARFILKTRQGDQEFTANGTSGYVRLNGLQICMRGHTTGPTLECNEVNLESVARAWWRQSQAVRRAQHNA